MRRSRRVLAAALLAGACGGSGGADVDAVVVATLELEPGAEPAALVSWGDRRLVIGGLRQLLRATNVGIAPMATLASAAPPAPR